MGIRWVKVAVTVGGAVVALLGCSSSGTDAQGGAGTGGITLAEYWRGLFGLYCDGMAGCCSAAGMPFNDAACRAPILSGSDPDYLPPPADRVDFDGAAAAACLEAMRAQVRGCQSPDWDHAPAACAGVLRGAVPVGGACDRHFECATSPTAWAVCFDGDGAAGRCVASPRGAEGDPCFGTCGADGCGHDGTVPTPLALCHREDGLYCHQESGGTAGTCTPTVAAGAACDSWGGACAEGLVCRSPEGIVAGICGDPAALGEPCQDDGGCASGICDFSADYPTCADSRPPPEVSEYLCAGNRE